MATVVDTVDVDFLDLLDGSNEYDIELERYGRSVVEEINPNGFTIRHPPKPHELITEITDDTALFQTIHMGAAVVNEQNWRLVVDGMVQKPFSLTLSQLMKMPSSTITSFHECYGSPIKPPTEALWRVGNVRWTGVPLKTLLDIAGPLEGAKFVWSEGLEHGSFASFKADRYQKDLPMAKAVQPEVMLAYEMNGEPLTKERGFPVRLIVPGWLGTNSTKWICHLTLQSDRAPGPFTMKLYNEIDPHDPAGRKWRPVWSAEVNSMICRPVPNQKLTFPELLVWGRAWGCEEVKLVEISIDGGRHWIWADLQPRAEFEWQCFEAKVVFPLRGRKYQIIARATDVNAVQQPLAGRRNHVHSVEVEVA